MPTGTNIQPSCAQFNPEDDFFEGYRDGLATESPEPSENRSHCYRHGFMVGRADRAGKPVDLAREKAAIAEAKDKEAAVR
jgi:hypothetical protein